MIRDPSSAANR